MFNNYNAINYKLVINQYLSIVFSLNFYNQLQYWELFNILCLIENFKL